MLSGKSYIIWMPKNGSGKSRQFAVNPVYLMSLSIVLFISVLLIPLLETQITGLNVKLAELEQRKYNLESEVTSLKYLKENLAGIEKNNRMLTSYFGFENNKGINPEFSGIGGTAEISEYSTEIHNRDGVNISPHGLHEKLKILKSNLKVYTRLLEEKDLLADFTPNILPVGSKKIRISSDFGWRKNPFTKRKEFHAGIDISGGRGTKIIAPANGIIIREGFDRHLGKYIVIQHNSILKTIYGHLNSILVKEGDEVKRGDRIGLMGNSGLSTSSHLHYSVVKNDRAVNPMQYILDMQSNS